MIEKCVSELSNIRKMKSDLMEGKMINQNNLNLLIEKLNILESSIVDDDIIEIDEYNETPENEVEDYIKEKRSKEKT